MPDTTKNEARKAQSLPNADSNFFLRLSIKGVELDTPVVISMTIREWIFDVLPRIEIELYDNGRYTDQYPLEDNDEIKVELNNISTKESIVDCTFLLQDHEILNAEPGKTDNLIIKITGIYKNTNIFFPLQNRSFSGQNSKQVLQTISSENGYSFVSPIDPADKMTWLQINQNNNDFVHHVVDRSFITNDTTFCYVNRKNEMVYTSLKNEVTTKKEVKNYYFNLISTVLNTGQTPNQSVQKRLDKEKEEIGSDNVSFFMNWAYKNIAGTVNKNSSYGRNYNYYDFQNEVDEDYALDDVLLSQHSNKEKDNIGKIVAIDNYGTFDSQNTYENYLIARTQNRYLKDDFFNSYLMVYSRPEPNVKLFDVVNIAIPTPFKVDTTLNEVHSGEYIVGGIIHSIARKSVYNSILILYRNGRNIKGFLKEGEVRHSRKG